jgi:hypothetical protein
MPAAVPVVQVEGKICPVFVFTHHPNSDDPVSLVVTPPHGNAEAPLV